MDFIVNDLLLDLLQTLKLLIQITLLLFQFVVVLFVAIEKTFYALFYVGFQTPLKPVQVLNQIFLMQFLVLKLILFLLNFVFL